MKCKRIERERRKVERIILRAYRRRHMERARQAAFNTANVEMEVDQLEYQRSRPVRQLEIEGHNPEYIYSHKEWDAAYSLFKMSRKTAHQLKTQERKLTHCPSQNEWEAVLSLINMSRMSGTKNSPTSHSRVVPAATLKLIQLRREGAEFARPLTVKDVRAALALVELGREGAHWEMFAAAQVLVAIAMSTLI